MCINVRVPVEGCVAMLQYITKNVIYIHVCIHIHVTVKYIFCDIYMSQYTNVMYIHMHVTYYVYACILRIYIYTYICIYMHTHVV